MATESKSSLSAGLAVRRLLIESKAVTAITSKIFPLVIDKATLPYILYRRARLDHNPTKAGMPGADSVIIEVNCYTEGYDESIRLAEAVRSALDYARYSDDHITMRSCTLTDSSEDWADDAFVQNLIFTIKI